VLARVVVVKLGGSVITDKTKDFTYRQDVVSALAEEIAASDMHAAVVHGGGSFGHPVAMKYGLSSSSYSRIAEGVWQTRNAMYELNTLVCKTMNDSKLRPYPFSPFNILMFGIRKNTKLWLHGLLKNGMTPVTFGDVVLERRGFTILSGDTIALELSRILRPERCVFAMDVDGLYEKESSVIIPEISYRKLSRLSFDTSHDATGGMKKKINIASKIASMGIEVRFVSGYRRNEFAKALKGEEFYGTKIVR
jgi:isopentenyl phosphate kinase